MGSVTLSKPHDVYIILTAKCNLRCIHCYGDYGEKVPAKELSTESWINIIEDLAKNDIFYVNISGGEPTCHPGFEKIVDALIKNKMYFVLTTNGLFNDKILNKIIASKEYLLGIKISLDGADYESHGFIRRSINGNISPINFNKTTNVIKALRSNDINVSVGTCLHAKNIAIVDKMKELIIELSPNSWYLSTISISGRADKHNEIFVSESYYDIAYWHKLKAELADHGIIVEFVDMPNLIKSDVNRDVYFQCPAARWFCEINSDGMVSPCPLARTSIPSKILMFENIREKSIDEIWNGSSFNQFRQWQHSGCEGCKAAGECDRCVPQSIQWFDDPLSPPPYCVAHAKKLGIKNQADLKARLDQQLSSKQRIDYVGEKE